MLHTEVTSLSQQVLYGQAIETFNKLVELRRQRIESISTSMLGVLWAVVLVGALITIAFFYGFVVASLRLHALLTGLLALILSLRRSTIPTWAKSA